MTNIYTATSLSGIFTPEEMAELRLALYDRKNHLQVLINASSPKYRPQLVERLDTVNRLIGAPPNNDLVDAASKDFNPYTADWDSVEPEAF